MRTEINKFNYWKTGPLLSNQWTRMRHKLSLDCYG
jgi:hypothetical protein